MFDENVKIKEALTNSPILHAFNWDLHFELTCDSSNFTLGAVLG